ncbi:Rieske (2Fe-2S) protein (plasmid) [Shimia sp. W99]
MQSSAQSQTVAPAGRDAHGTADGAGAWIATCPRSALDGAEARGFEPRHRFAVIVLECAGEVRAYRDLCPHYGKTRLAWKRDAYMTGDNARILCSAHGAEFDPITGDCVVGACLGQRLASVPVRLTDDDIVELWVPAAPSLTL